MNSARTSQSGDQTVRLMKRCRGPHITNSNIRQQLPTQCERMKRKPKQVTVNCLHLACICGQRDNGQGDNGQPDKGQSRQQRLAVSLGQQPPVNQINRRDDATNGTELIRKPKNNVG